MPVTLDRPGSAKAARYRGRTATRGERGVRRRRGNGGKGHGRAIGPASTEARWQAMEPLVERRSGHPRAEQPLPTRTPASSAQKKRRDGPRREV